MKVIYSIGANLGGHGIGSVAYQAARGIYKAGVLGKVLASYVRPRGAFEIPQDCIESMGLIGAGLRRLAYYTPGEWGYLLHDNTFDLWVRCKLRLQPGCRGGVFHGWNHHCLFSLRKAKSLGAITIVERASAHPLAEKKIIAEEYRHFGVRAPSVPSLFTKKCLAEFEEADYITVPSRFAYQSMVENGVDEKKLIKIPFGVNREKFKVQSSKFKIGSKFTALFVGQISLRKGVHYLLQAWDRLKLKDAELWLVGNVDSEMEETIRPFRAHPNVKFLGFRRDVPRLMAKASIFVFPSLFEGSALVTYEAMAAGLPVITTFNSGSVVRDGQEGFIVPIRDVDSLAERIKYLYDHSQEIEKMGKSARKQVSNYTWERYGERLVEFYGRIV